MKQAIKKRIEQINAGQVPEGYKRTHMGCVPAEWKIVRLRDLFDRMNRRNTAGNENVLTVSAQFGLINQEDFFNKKVASEIKDNYFLLYRGDFAYNKSYSTGYPYGAIKALEKYDVGVLSPLYICFTPKEGTDADFYKQFFDSQLYNHGIYRIAQEGARNHGLLNMRIDDFFDISLPSPLSIEQQRIAEILLTWDKAIAIQEEMIRKLEERKRGLMQKLLAEKRHWKKCDLEEIAGISTGNRDVKDNDENGLYPLYIRSEKIMRINSYTFEGEGLFIPGEGKIGEIIHYHNGKCSFHQRVYCLSEFKNCNGKYLYYSLMLNFKKRALSYTAKATVDSIRREMLAKMIVYVPPMNEQEVVCKVLTRADSEILVNKQKHAALKLQKKALMQLLLTGIVRVKV